MRQLQIVGRTSSLFTRVPRIFAHALGVPYELVPVHDLTALDAAAFGDNPARKLPTLVRPDGGRLFGAASIARAITEVAAGDARVVWPEDLRDDRSRNAHELVGHAMAAQVQLVFGTLVNGLPADNRYFAKGRAGFEGALRWLDDHLAATLAGLPGARDLSLLEVSLLCLVEHLGFRGTLPVAPYPALAAFAEAYGERPACRATAYAFDAPPPEPRSEG